MVPRYGSTRAVFGDVQRHQYMVRNLGIWGWIVIGLMDPLPNSVIHSSTWNNTTYYIIIMVGCTLVPLWNLFRCWFSMQYMRAMPSAHSIDHQLHGKGRRVTHLQWFGMIYNGSSTTFLIDTRLAFLAWDPHIVRCFDPFTYSSSRGCEFFLVMLKKIFSENSGNAAVQVPCFGPPGFIQPKESMVDSDFTNGDFTKAGGIMVI